MFSFWVTVMEKLMGSWEKLSLSESEGNKFAIRDDQEAEEHLLAAKFPHQKSAQHGGNC